MLATVTSQSRLLSRGRVAGAVMGARPFEAIIVRFGPFVSEACSRSHYPSRVGEGVRSRRRGLTLAGETRNGPVSGAVSRVYARSRQGALVIRSFGPGATGAFAPRYA